MKRNVNSIGRILWPIIAIVGLSAPALGEPRAVSPPTVILISMDGTRPEDVTLSQLPSLVELGSKGLRAEALLPVDPTNTFPNHVTLVTGVLPEQHRLANNRFIDPIRGRFSRKEIHSWIESEPIWSVAERHGLPAASFYWVGSEGPWRDGPGPSVSRKFSSRTREKTKVTQILKWLEIKDPTKRPRLITAWFHGADHAAHLAGPGGRAVAVSLAPQNLQIARLVREMEKRDLFDSTTLIFVSDHGMAKASKRLNLAKRLRDAGLKCSLSGIGGFAIGVFKDAERTDANLAHAVKIARRAGMQAWIRTEAPKDWHVADPRFGDFVVRAPIGTALVRRMTVGDGFHGYAASEPEMAGILVARGRGVAIGSTPGRVSNLSIAPTILMLLGLPVPPQMKGSPIEELLQGIVPKANRSRMSSVHPGDIRVGDRRVLNRKHRHLAGDLSSNLREGH